ncbi:MAG: TIGR00341 family protein, partial [Chloroflexi bacterium]|nr:TIGR00341 family protein [Chloroflexota bacterium]
VLVLGVVSVPEQLPPEEGQRQAREKQVLMEWALAHGREAGVPIHAVTRIARDVAQGIIDAATEEHCHLILMNWSDLSTTPGLSAVIQNAPCEVAAIQGTLGDSVRSILVPTHGGPNTPPAVRLGVSLLDPDQGTVTVMCVAPNNSALERQVALGYIQDGLADVEDRSRVVEKVVAAPSAVTGIVQEAEHHDAVILGASEEGLFDRLVFGDFPEIVARRCTRPVIMTKRTRGLAVFWLRRVVQSILDRLPRLTTEQRITVYRDIRHNARPGANYYVLIALSCVIATLGLVVNSPAVVIGAMLVAPLMSPIMALSLSIVLGDARLLRLAAQAVFQGTVAAIGISLFLGWLSPYNLVTAEMAARTQPTLLDLGIALASGAAGAYAIARDEVSAALPGVAIAAALMPPLSVVGLGLSIGRWDAAGGALLLFLTNLIAITLAGSLVFLGLGFRTGRMVFQFETRRGLAITLTLLVLISIPLAFIMLDALQSTRLQQGIDNTLHNQIGALPAAHLDQFEYEQADGRLIISVWIDTAQAIDERTLAGIRAALERDLGEPVTLRLFITAIEYQEVR